MALIALAGLVLRLVNNDYGLPYVYSADEGSHFTNRAVEMFAGDPNPGYFQNPSAFTYLAYAALWLRDTGLWPVGPRSVPEQFAIDPTPIWITGRTLAAVLCTLGVIGVYVVGRREFGARAGVAAAAVLAFAFLPVAYSRVAVTDVGTLLPVALSLDVDARRLAHRPVAGLPAGRRRGRGRRGLQVHGRTGPAPRSWWPRSCAHAATRARSRARCAGLGRGARSRSS